MILRKAYSFIISLVILLSSQVCSEVYFRTYVEQNVAFVSIDFHLKYGEHLTAPIGKGKSIAPKCSWKNAEVLEVFWPEDSVLPNDDGSESDYRVFYNECSVFYKLKIADINRPISYDLFYVKCNESACIPCDKSGELVFNNELTKQEIDKYVSSKEEPIAENMFVVLLFGLLGGIILNFMPCVFPIISIKIFSIVKSSSLSNSKIRKQGIACALGSVFTIVSLGGLLLLIRSTFPNVGWGFFMQSPIFVFLLLLILILSALHFWDVYPFYLPLLKKRKYSSSNIYLTSFLSGVLVAITSSSCAGPFSGIALSSALLYSNPFQSMAIFTMLGTGLASPFILLSIFPGIVNKFPKPGNWLNTFKKIMGFAMLFSCLWPISVLLTQLPHVQIIQLLAIIFAIVFALWLMKHSKKPLAKYLSISAILLLGLNGALLITNKETDVIEWQEYSDKLLNESLENHRPVFLNFTASWCLNCQFNQRVFSDKEIVDEFRKKKVIAIKCDWTQKNDEIAKLLKKYNSVAIPLNIYYPGQDFEFKTLPSVLTKSVVIKYLNGER